MSDSAGSVGGPPAPGNLADLDEHPRGTLAIVCVFGVLFVLGWFAVYVLVFLERGAPHP